MKPPAAAIRSGHRRRIACACAAALLACGAASAQGVDESALKAAIVYRLLAFVDWPAARLPETGGTLVLCVEPTHPTAAPLRQLARSGVRQWVLEVRDTPPAPLAACHAWMGSTPPHDLRAGDATLLLSDRPRRLDTVTHVWLVRDGERVGFELDLANARRAGLKISAKLARLARDVRE